MIILLAAALQIAVTNQPSVPRCALQHLAACNNTNQLVWDKAFERQVRAYSGKARTDAFGTGALSEALLTTLGGPPDGPVTLEDGNMLFTACVAHACTEKGAIVLTPDGSIVAAAMLTNHFVHEGDLKWTKADDAYSRLDFFVKAPLTGEPPWHGAITDWAKLAYRGDREVFDKYWRSLGLTESIWLIRPGSNKLQKLTSKRLFEMPSEIGKSPTR